MNARGDGHQQRAVTVHTPVRIADVGGWTDTWFAGSGAVCHLGVGPGITVRAEFSDGPTGGFPVRIVAPDVDADYRCGPSPTTGWDEPQPGRHPLIEHAVASVLSRFPISDGLRIHISSEIPPGASLGTSASLVVATISALEALIVPSARASDWPGDEARHAVATAAHHVETAAVGRESGVQDQWAAAFGGAQLLEVAPYPNVQVTPIALDASILTAIAENVVTVIVGPHDSSSTHRQVISRLRSSSAAGASGRRILGELAELAHMAADALARSDLETWADTLTQATEAQSRLHPSLVGSAHRQIIDLARTRGAIGWKVNGAGGDGGSVSVVFGSPIDPDPFIAHVRETNPSWGTFRLPLTTGITVEWG